jgi:hypothetical protein
VSTPTRIQRKRTKGWRLPPDAIYVGRPSPWGNRFILGRVYTMPSGDRRLDPETAVALFRIEVDHAPRAAIEDWLAPLRGHDLVCWCPLDQPCHADVLLELANA